MPAHAYDLEMLHRAADRTDPGCQGWVFGLPPGITPAQWPLDTNTGYPLAHGFTLLLPPEYRCHGADIVALSFFAVSLQQDHNDGGPQTTRKIRDVMRSASAVAPDDPDLLPFGSRCNMLTLGYIA